MAILVRMPSFGLTEGAALITRWIKQEGDSVSVGEILFEAENEKAVLEVPAPADGILLRILVVAGQMSPLRGEVALLGAPGERAEMDPEVTQVRTDDFPVQTAPGIPAESRRRVSPVARKFARANGLDLDGVQGTGPRGRIKLSDVEACLAASARFSPPQVQSSTTEDIQTRKRLRMQIAHHVAEAARTAVSVPLWIDADLSEVERLRERTRDEYLNRLEASLSINTLLARATVCMLHEYPELNAWWNSSGPELQPETNLAIAVDTPVGLLAPVLHRADQFSLIELQHQISILMEWARSRRCQPEELRGSTFTLTNLGGLGITTFVPVLNPPEVGILAAGQSNLRAIPVDGTVQIRPVITLCLVFDHRALDGAPVARALSRLKALLENPYLLL